jgi:hypothetical protein
MLQLCHRNERIHELHGNNFFKLLKLNFMRQNRNSIMRGASGALGNELVFRQRAGKTVISLPPVFRADNPTASQQEVRTRFQEASAYAKAALANPETKAAYAARANAELSPYNLALADYFKPPIIQTAEAQNFSGSPGDTISIRATDDFKVQAVYVQIMDEAGTILEEGPATASAESTDTWAYTLANAQTAAAKAKVTASDLPGNQVSRELEL